MDENRLFDNNTAYVTNMGALVKRDRNHPSVRREKRKERRRDEETKGKKSVPSCTVVQAMRMVYARVGVVGVLV